MTVNQDYNCNWRVLLKLFYCIPRKIKFNCTLSLYRISYIQFNFIIVTAATATNAPCDDEPLIHILALHTIFVQLKWDPQPPFRFVDNNNNIIICFLADQLFPPEQHES